ncbi:MAG: hypothetical protein RMZ41_016255 [Nostoc sp. DedVER02]|nr:MULTISPECIES: hypothetical protein [unclassified Nostoc]MDZ7988405.1 hypothetical protein [Nostoc sp. DedVER02]MDZ8112143.1 hypothetical protein [Nostoc sp. DedVER01b]
MQTIPQCLNCLRWLPNEPIANRITVHPPIVVFVGVSIWTAL